MVLLAQQGVVAQQENKGNLVTLARKEIGDHQALPQIPVPLVLQEFREYQEQR
jgi:hypothetical protein